MPPFDTLRFSQRLRDAGFERGQAEALTLAIADAISEDAAANADVKRTEQDIGEVMADLKQDIAELKVEIAKLDGKMEAMFGKLEGKLFRGLWIQGGTTVAILAGLYMIANALG